MPYIKGIAHAAINTADLDAAIRFYSDGLGMELRHRSVDAAILAPPDGVLLELFGGGQPASNRSGFSHICLNTYDADAAFSRALACGASATRGNPYDLGKLRIAFVTAPTGEEVEFWHIGGRREVADGRHIKSFVHAALTVPDMDYVARFYEGMGALPKVTWGWGCSMKLADGRELEIFSGGEACDGPSGIAHVCFYTDDVDGALRHALELGATLHAAPQDWANIRFAFFHGLAGELVELFHLYPDRQADFFLPSKPFDEVF